MIILGIDTSCDETSASILNNGTILSNIIYSQSIHSKFGGVVPNLASKDHEKNIYNTVNESIKVANITISDINAVAVTYKPGLIGSLLVGLNFAKGLAIGLNIPLIPVNHLEGHLSSALINNKNIYYPYLCFLVSGGHTQIWKVNSSNDYNIISTTVDDAAGEAFDKGAQMLNLEYPGGPEIEKYARFGDPDKFKFTIPRVKNNPLNFSFSGTKTALYYLLKEYNEKEISSNLKDLCASYQENIIDTLLLRLKDAAEKYQIYNISIVGGVSCNERFRYKAENFINNKKKHIHFPEMQFCTDNGAMIAMAGYLKLCENKNILKLDVIPKANVEF